MNKIVNEVITSLETFKDPKRVEFSKDYHPTIMKIIGVSIPNVRLVLKELKGLTQEWSETKKIQLLKNLLETNLFECQLIAYLFLEKNKQIWKILKVEDIVELGKNVDNWVSVDTYSIYVVGQAWRRGLLDDDFIKNHLKSDDVWQRRIAIVSTVALNLKSQDGKGDLKRTLDICKLVVEDYHDMIVKALSWALRELAKRYKDEVQDFIDMYDEVLHKKVLSEVANKLVFGKKKPGFR